MKKIAVIVAGLAIIALVGTVFYNLGIANSNSRHNEQNESVNARIMLFVNSYKTSINDSYSLTSSGFKEAYPKEVFSNSESFALLKNVTLLKDSCNSGQVGSEFITKCTVPVDDNKVYVIEATSTYNDERKLELTSIFANGVAF